MKLCNIKVVQKYESLFLAVLSSSNEAYCNYVCLKIVFIGKKVGELLEA